MVLFESAAGFGFILFSGGVVGLMALGIRQLGSQRLPETWSSGDVEGGFLGGGMVGYLLLLRFRAVYSVYSV